MKKLFSLAIALFSIISFFWISIACENISYNDGSLCININKNWNTYTMSNGLNCPWWGCSLSCMIQLPDSTMREVWACNGSFTWNWASQWLVKVWATLNGIQKSSHRNYNFSIWNWEWASTTATWLNNFHLSTNRSEPSTSQWSDLTIRARNSSNDTLTNYANKVRFRVYYRASTNSAWTETTSSTYYTINSNFTNWYTFSTSDSWQRNLSDFIRFNTNNHHYKVRVYDDNNPNIYNEIVFYVWTTSNISTDLDNFLLSTNRYSPSTSQWSDLTIRARNSSNVTLTTYREKVRFRVYYRNTSSSSWTETTSSTYYTINSNFTNWYTFSTSDYWQRNLSDFIRFNTNNLDYKVRVYDDNNPNIYNEIIFYVWSSTNTSNLDNFLLSTNRSSPTTSQWSDLTIRARNSSNNTLSNFNERVRFRVYYRTSSSSSWTETTSSTYYTISSSFNNWYTFYTYDYWVKTLSDFIKFNRNNYDYKVRVYADNNPSIYNEIIFYVWTSSSTNSNVAGFTTKELEMVQRIYNLWPQLINQLRVEYPSFRTNTTWINLGNSLYSNMKDVLDNKSSRKFTNYTKFFTDFEVWYSRTINVIH